MVIEKDPRYDVILADVDGAQIYEDTEAQPDQALPVALYGGSSDEWRSWAQQPFYVYQHTHVVTARIWARGSASGATLKVSVYRDRPSGGTRVMEVDAAYTESADWVQVMVPLGIHLQPGLYVFDVYTRSIAESPVMPLQVGGTAPVLRRPGYYFADVDSPGSPYMDGTAGEWNIAFDLVSDGEEAVETLPLMLSEGGGPLGFDKSWVSPFAGQLSAGQPREQDLSQYKVRTQRDWRGGRGLEVADELTNRFMDSLADTRYENRVMLGPRAKMSGQPGAGLAWTPGDVDAGVPITYTEVQAYWLGRPVDVPDWRQETAGVQAISRLVEAKWTVSALAKFMQGDATGQVIGARECFARYATNVQYPQQIKSDATYLAGGAPNYLAQSVVHTSDMQISSVDLKFAQPAGRTTTVEIRATGTDGKPGPTVLGSGSISTPTAYDWVRVQMDTPALVPANTKVWICLRHNGAQSDVIDVVYGKIWTGSFVQWWPAGVWTNIEGNLTFRINGGTVASEVRTNNVAQQMVVAGGGTATKLRFHAKLNEWVGGATVTLKVRVNTAGNEPGDVLASMALARSEFNGALTAANWIERQLDMVLAAGTYWVEIDCDVSAATTDRVSIAWTADTVEHYGGLQKTRQYIGAWGAWQAQVGDCFFELTANMLSMTRAAMSFQVGTDVVSATKLQLYLQPLARAGNGGVKVRLCSDNAGSPGTMLREVTIAAAEWANLAARYIAVTITAQSLSVSTKYWIALEPVAATVADAVSLYWWGDAKLGAPAGYAAKVGAYATGAWGAWGTPSPDLDLFFIINDGDTQTNDKELRKAAEMSFVAPAGGMALTTVYLFCFLSEWVGSPSVTLKIYNDSGGSPNLLMASAQAISRSTFTTAGAHRASSWVPFPLVGTLNMPAGTRFHIVMEATAPGGSRVTVKWRGAAGYGDGVAQWRPYDTSAGWKSWSPLGFDLFFVLNDGRSFALDVTMPPVEFGNGLWLAVGAVVYKWNESISAFESQATLGAVITALASFAGKLWAALGDGADMQNSANGTSWSAVTDRAYTYLRNPDDGYLYVAKAVGGTKAYAYTDGTSWTEVDVGRSDVANTALREWGGEMMLMRATGFWKQQGPGYVALAMSYTELNHSDNGRGAATWAGDRRFYVPVGQSLLAFDGTSTERVGLDRDAGLPAEQRGRITAMVSLADQLIVAVDAGAAGRSGIYVYNGVGWHCLALASAIGRRIRVLGYDRVTSTTPRLWYWEGKTTYFLSLYDDPRQAPAGSVLYQSEGLLITSWWMGELTQITKDLQSVVISSEGCSDGQTVDVYMEVDRSGHWWHVGTVAQSPYQELTLAQVVMQPKTLAAGCTERVMKVAGETALYDLFVGQFVRVAGEVAQVASIDSATQFTLVLPLRQCPMAGTVVYASRPAGRAVRLKLVLRSESATQTPVVTSVSVRYQEQLVDRAVYTLRIPIADGLVMRTGTDGYPYTAADLRARLETWVKRISPFVLVEPDGRNTRVKSMPPASETGWRRQEVGADQATTMRSTLTMQLVEA